jgi:hypothetical protein
MIKCNKKKTIIFYNILSEMSINLIAVLTEPKNKGNMLIYS